MVAGRARLIAGRTVIGDDAIPHAESIERQADRMATIIRQLLDFARRRRVTLAPTDLRNIVGQTVAMLGSIASKHRTELATSCPTRRSSCRSTARCCSKCSPTWW